MILNKKRARVGGISVRENEQHLKLQWRRTDDQLPLLFNTMILSKAKIEIVAIKNQGIALPPDI